MSKYSYKPHASYWLRDWEDDDILVTNMNDVERKFLYHFSYSNLNKCEAINPLYTARLFDLHPPALPDDFVNTCSLLYRAV